MAACLIADLQKAGHKTIKFDKLWEITQRLDENPAQFLARLTEVLQKYTKLDPTWAEGTIVLNTHFISQSSPDIQKKLKKSEEGPQIPQWDLLNLSLKIFNNQEEQANLEPTRSVQMPLFSHSLTWLQASISQQRKEATWALLQMWQRKLLGPLMPKAKAPSRFMSQL